MSASSPLPAAARPVAELAKATLRRLALQRLEPTPENYARAYAAESGLIAAAAGAGGIPAPSAAEETPDGEAWAALIERTLRGVERSGRGWTPARRKDSLQRVLAGSRSDARRLHQRLQQLVGSWDDPAAAPAPPLPPSAETGPVAPAAAPPVPPPGPSVGEEGAVPLPRPDAAGAAAAADPRPPTDGSRPEAPTPGRGRGDGELARTAEAVVPPPTLTAGAVARAVGSAAAADPADLPGAAPPGAAAAPLVPGPAARPAPAEAASTLPQSGPPAGGSLPLQGPTAGPAPDGGTAPEPAPMLLGADVLPASAPAVSVADPTPAGPGPASDAAADPGMAGPGPTAAGPAPAAGPQPLPAESAPPASAWPQALDHLGRTVGEALPPGEGPARELAQRISAWPRGLDGQGPGPQQLADLAAACDEARRLIGHRHHWTETLAALCQELTASLAELAEDESWARGQTQLMQAQLDAGLGPRGVRQAGSLLAATRAQQQRLRGERQQAREALKTALRQMLDDIAVLGRESGRYADRLDHHAAAIAAADTLEGLAERVRDMVAESRAVHGIVAQTQARLQEQQACAEAMQQRVRGLEDEIRRLSDEVSTDPLTQIANRRGLQRAFETECARQVRAAHGPAVDEAPPPPLAVGLLDIDNFKRLNDRLGHASGDAALQFLARRVSQALRPQDTLARYGGEEFVVLLPATPLEEARQVLNRLQRMLSAELFASDGEERVFVTFSAGVTALRPGEGLDAVLARADIGLYEAKRTGKNRSCVA